VRTDNPAIAEGLAASGVVVASIDFRMGGTDPYPSSLADMNYATRWLKLHAAEFKADAATVGGLGVSSGGHLIMLSAMRPFDPRYTALPLAGADELDATLAYAISCWGVLDPLGRYRMAEARGNTNLMENHERYQWLPSTHGFPPGGLQGIYSPDPVCWGSNLANDAIDPPASFALCTINPDGSVTVDSTSVPLAANAVPEPSTLLLASGLLGFVAYRWQRR